MPLVTTIMLFLGPLVQEISSEPEQWYPSSLWQSLRHNVHSLIWWRNFVVAPIAEEWVFRACMIPLLSAAGFQFKSLVFLPPLLFGLAHTHHVVSVMRERQVPLLKAILVVLFQVFYTTVFGAMAAYYFLLSQCIYGAILAHAFCNMMGFPDFQGAWEAPNKRTVVLAYLAGIVIYVVAMSKMTAILD